MSAAGADNAVSLAASGAFAEAAAPAGVGVTITAGEILDPLNDLIERFSWLVLMASASLGTQLVLTDIFATPALTIAQLAARARRLKLYGMMPASSPGELP